MLEALKRSAARLGKPAWRGMLGYVAELHERSIHEPAPPLDLPWEEIGPGYCYAPAFGHWDIVHQVLDVLPDEADHARCQLLNNLSLQRDDGMLEGSIFFQRDGTARTGDFSHPPVWPVALEQCWRSTGEGDLLRRGLDAAVKQARWFAENRAAPGGGYYYCDLVVGRWESGVDEGVRFDDPPAEPQACIDATAHVAVLCDHAAVWAERLGRDALPFARAAAGICDFVRGALFDEETGLFHDAWAVGNPARRPLAFEGIWPLVARAASDRQAGRLIDENLLNPDRFLTRHPIATVAASDPHFELRMWRGPAWNSMTYWAALGCLRYDRPDAARTLLERALDAAADVFESTGTVWEFYHPHGGSPLELKRKARPVHRPCRDYLGHNPLIAMARLWEAAAP